MQKKPVEKRIHPRRPFRAKIVFDDELGDGLFYVYSQDISLGGLYLASDIPVRVGTLLFLSFQVPPHKRPVSVIAEVIRCQDVEGAAARGMGVRFVGLPEPARKWITDFLDS